MKKSDLRKLIRECLLEVLDTDNPETARAFAQMHKEKDIKGQSAFVKQYIKTALWSSTTGLEPSGGDPLDKQYTVDDIDHKTLIRMAKDAKDFQDRYGELYEKGGWSDEQAAHDFWLDRNGHGTGFKDRGYEYDAEDIGNELSKAAKAYGSYDLYLGDGPNDGILFGYPPD